MANRKSKDCPPGKEFVFKTPSGGVVGRAKNMMEFSNLLKSAPIASVEYHANGGHFSPWLDSVMGESRIASTLKGVRGTGEGLRRDILRYL